MRILRSNLTAGLLDQAMVSMGNFALSVGLARILSVGDFGVYSVAMSFLLFFNTLHQAFIIYPLSVHTAGMPPGRSLEPLCVAALLTLPCALPFLFVLAAGLWSIGHIALLKVASLALLAWQIQEVFRRSLIARGRYGLAILIDGVRYLGPLAVILVHTFTVTVTNIFLVVAILSAASVLPLVPLLRQSKTTVSVAQELVTHWHLAFPVLGANLLSVFTTQWYLWLLAWKHTPSAAASLVALTNVVAVASPVMLGAENILVPQIARMRNQLTFAGLIGVVGRHCLYCVGLVAPFFLAIALYPREVLGLIYGAASPYGTHIPALEMLVGVYVCFVLSYILAATLRGYRAGAAVFSMQLYPAMLGITLGSWLTIRFGLDGAALASLLAGVVRVGLGGYHVMRLRGETVRPPAAVLAS
jgi:O-antigen/teichoic acid export membrane protein